MTRKEKNLMYWTIATFTLDWYKENAKRNYFELTHGKIYELAKLAEACNIKPRKGWSKARTLWQRIYEGRPF